MEKKYCVNLISPSQKILVTSQTGTAEENNWKCFDSIDDAESYRFKLRLLVGPKQQTLTMCTLKHTLIGQLSARLYDEITCSQENFNPQSYHFWYTLKQFYCSQRKSKELVVLVSLMLMLNNK